jgi:hypothetical protein
MKKLSHFLFLFALAAISLAFAPPAQAQNDKFRTSRNAIPNRYIVVLSDDAGRVNELFNNVLSAETVGRVTKDLTASYGGSVGLV